MFRYDPGFIGWALVLVVEEEVADSPDTTCKVQVRVETGEVFNYDDAHQAGQAAVESDPAVVGYHVRVF